MDGWNVFSTYRNQILHLGFGVEQRKPLYILCKEAIFGTQMIDGLISEFGCKTPNLPTTRGRVKRLPLGGRGSWFAHTGAPAGKLAITTSG